MDLKNAYHLVDIHEGDEWNTALNTSEGHYEYLVMPFGLTNTPVFQALVNEVLRGMLTEFVFAYLDDIVISSPDLETHKHYVCHVLRRLVQHPPCVKVEKYEVHATLSGINHFIE